MRKQTAVPPLPLLLFMILVGGTVIFLGWQRYEGYNAASFDLGTISQAIWSGTQGQPLVHTRWGVPFSRLAEHVELFYLLIVPLYALWASPKLLIVVQGVLFIAGAWPLYQLALRRLGQPKWASRLVIAYLLYPVGLTAVLFEFHGDTLAMPLLLFALNALDQQKHRTYWVWLTLALSCKFYVAVPVFVMGFVWFWQETDIKKLRKSIPNGANSTWQTLSSAQKTAVYTMLIATLWGAITFFGIRSTLAPPSDVAKNTAEGYLAYYFGSLSALRADWLNRVTTGLLVYMPVFILGSRAPHWLLVASSTALPVLLSTGPGPAYAYRFHHYALAVPFLLMAVIAGAKNVEDKRKQFGLNTLLLMVLLFGFALPDFPFSPTFYNPPFGSGYGMDVTGYVTTPRDNFKTDWLAQQIPPNAPIMADNLTALRLVNRPLLYLTTPQFSTFEQALQDVQWVAVDALYDLPITDGYTVYANEVSREHGVIQQLLIDEAFQLMQMADGLMLFERTKTARLPHAVTIQIEESTPATEPALFQGLWAEEHTIHPLNSQQVQFRFRWVAPTPIEQPFFIVTHLEGFPQTRVVHFPLLTVDWQKGNTIVEEQFTVDWPLDGAIDMEANWVTAVYNPTSPYAFFTDDRSRLSTPFYTKPIRGTEQN